jgi:hypothetical protein
MSRTCELSNAAYRLTVQIAEREVDVVLHDMVMDVDLSDGGCVLSEN